MIESSKFLQNLPKMLTTKDISMLFSVSAQAAQVIMLEHQMRPKGTMWNTTDVMKVIGERFNQLHYARKELGYTPKSSQDQLNDSRKERADLDTAMVRKTLIPKAQVQMELITIFALIRSRVKIISESMASTLEPSNRSTWRKSTDDMLASLVDECEQAMTGEHRHILNNVSEIVEKVDKKGVFKKVTYD